MTSTLSRARRRKAAGAGTTAAGLALAGLALAGCGSSGPSTSAGSSGQAQSGAMTSAGQQVTITGNSMLKFSPMTVHVHPGTVRITLKDSGSYPHNIVIPALHVTSASVTGDPGSDQTSFTVKFPHSGRYAFHCQYHSSAGMVGTFVVS